MTEGRKQRIINIYISEGDTRIENKTDTQITDSQIDQVNIHQGIYPDQTRNYGARDGIQNSLRYEILRAQAASLCEKSKFREAANLLEKIAQTQKKYIGTLLLIAEVSIQLGQKQKAKKVIGEIVRLSMTSPSDVDDVFCYACDLIADISYVRSIVLLRIASDMYKLHPSLSPDDIVVGIRNCVDKIDDAVNPMIESGDRSKAIAIDCGLTYMVEISEDLRGLKHSNPNSATENEVYCLNLIVYNYYLANEHEKSIKFGQSGLNIMKRQFEKRASKYKMYGNLLNNLGAANSKLGRFSIAKNYYTEAIDAYNKATDFGIENAKSEYIDRVQNNLKNNQALTQEINALNNFV